jgi:hypothetical protein
VIKILALRKNLTQQTPGNIEWGDKERSQDQLEVSILGQTVLKDKGGKHLHHSRKVPS